MGEAKGAVQAVRRLHRTLQKLELFSIATLLVAVVVLVLVQIVTRHLLRRPPVWTEEAARYSLIWLVFLGAAYLASHTRLMRVTLFDARLSVRALRTFETMTHLITAIVAVVVLVNSTTYLQRVTNQHSAALGISMFWVYVSAAIGFALIAFHSLYHVLSLLSGSEDVEASTVVTLEGGDES